MARSSWASCDKHDRSPWEKLWVEHSTKNPVFVLCFSWACSRERNREVRDYTATDLCSWWDTLQSPEQGDWSLFLVGNSAIAGAGWLIFVLGGILRNRWSRVTEEKDMLTVAAYVLWNIRNERNRRIFQSSSLLGVRVAERIRAEIAQFRADFNLWVLPALLYFRSLFPLSPNA
jgi:hypothetical protein